MITKTNAYYIELEGNNYEVGKAMGYMAKSIPGLVNVYKAPANIFSKEEAAKVIDMFNQFCPGINEEIQGFADVLEIPAEQIIYYSWTYLKPGCSQMAVLPSITSDNHVMVARNYDMSEKIDEMKMCTTRIKGRYAHIGSSMILFGRGDGMNEHGLVVSQSSAGMPVGALPMMRKPKVTGLQFWAVIRTVLEQCRTVDEALTLVIEMPISYNINMILADRDGKAALVETLDGRKAVKKIDSKSPEQFLCATNHLVLPELKDMEPMKMKNSAARYELINDALSRGQDISKEELKNLLSRKYPEGLACSYYDDMFGTLRSMVFDPTDRTVDVRFGTPDMNDWMTFDFNGKMKSNVYEIKLEKERCAPDFFEFV